MVRESKISKKEGVKLCADRLFLGDKNADIVREFAEKYKVSKSCVDKWLKQARIIDTERRTDEEEAKRALIKETTEQVVKDLGLELSAILGEYKKIAFFDIRKIYTVDGGLKSIHDLDDDSAGAVAGIESFDEKQRDTGEVLGTTQKVKITNKVQALDSICKVLGYNSPDKIAKTKADGTDIFDITINLE